MVPMCTNSLLMDIELFCDFIVHYFQKTLALDAVQKCDSDLGIMYMYDPL